MPEPTWKSRVPFLNCTEIEHPVGGLPTKFWPISVGLLFELRHVIKPLAEALTVLFASTNRDAEQITRSVDGGQIFEGTYKAVSQNMADFRAKQRSDALGKAVESLTNDKTLNIVGKIIINSMREAFPSNVTDNPTPEQFMDEPNTLNCLPDMLMGVAKANKGVFNPLLRLVDGKEVLAAVREAGKELIQRVKDNGTSSAAESSTLPEPAASPLDGPATST